MLSGCATYRAGVALPETDTPVQAMAAQGPGRLVWLSLNDPSVEECERLAAILHLDHELTAVIEDTQPRASLRRYGDATVLMAGVARYDKAGDLVEIGALTTLSRPGVLVTITRHAPAEATELRRVLETREGALSQGAGTVVWHLVEAVVSGYAQVLKDLRADVEVLERLAFSTPTPANITQRLYLLKREAIDFRQAASALIDPLEDLESGRHSFDGDHAVPDWHLTRDRLLRQADRSVVVSDLLGGILTAYQTDVALRQNEDMRKISAWVAIAAVPTLLAGVYGMNFENMPELSYTWGYPMLLGVMVVVCGGLYLAFRKRDWL
ncbi:MAG: magnesium and cobalt transport protein CorA [Euzebya sp.]